MRADRVMHSFIQLKLPKIDSAQRSVAANAAFFEFASNIVSANIFAKMSLDQHSILVFGDKNKYIGDKVKMKALAYDRS